MVYDRSAKLLTVSENAYYNDIDQARDQHDRR